MGETMAIADIANFGYLFYPEPYEFFSMGIGQMMTHG